LAVNGENKRPEPPSPDQYERLKRQAETLRQSELSGRSDGAHKRSRAQQGMQAYARYTGMGLQFVILMLLPMGGGYLADNWLGTTPWLMLVGAAIGAVAAMVWLVKAVARMEARGKSRPGAKGS
jgi:ATP synthase protein I